MPYSGLYTTTILTGVPQDSVLGPLFFVLFISPVANVINSDQSNQNNTVSFHQYADDTQLYIGTNLSTLTSQIASIESCTQRVHDCFLKNGLHLNSSKSDAIAFYNSGSKLLAALVDWKLERSQLLALLSSFKRQLRIRVFTLTQKCALMSRRLKYARLVIPISVRHIRAFLTTEAYKTIAAAIVGSRLDFCNGLLAGTSVSNLTHLQRVQNTLARVVAREPRFCHITRTCPFGFALALGSPQKEFQNCYGYIQSAPLSAAILSFISHPKICTPLVFVFLNMRSST